MGIEWLLLPAFVVFAYLVVLRGRGAFFFSAFGDGYDGEDGGPGVGKSDVSAASNPDQAE